MNISVNELANTSTANLPREIEIFLAKRVLQEEDNKDSAVQSFQDKIGKLGVNTHKNVINASGTILHTNLGRAPLNNNAFTRYSNVEFDLNTGTRGERNTYLSTLMQQLLEVEDVAFVNNNASSLFVTLANLSKKFSHVIVSRGEIIEIGGSYRLPEIINESGLKLIEVGTTNKTRLKDYKNALEKYTDSVVLKVHRSNFSINGFTEEASIEELSTLKNLFNTVLIHDLGSGLVVSDQFLDKFNLDIFKTEMTVQSSIKKGSDLVMFSGDKLFGSIQSGVIAGKKDLIEDIKSYSLFRTFRCSPTVLHALQETTEKYVRKSELDIPFWQLVTEPYDNLLNRCNNIIQNISYKAEVVEGESVIGGGTMPDSIIKSPVIQISEAKSTQLLELFLQNVAPIIPRIVDNVICLDLRSVFEDQDKVIIDLLSKK